ncbi:MAG: FadL family outer membrane protein [Pseudomonadota bacterium]|jgi:long-chain fatty acid transport protein
MAKISTLALAVVSASFIAPAAWASGFKLNEQSASGVGTAFAGRAAVVEDASTVFYNPAGMSKLKRAEISLGAAYLNADVTFKNGVRNNAAGVPSTFETGTYDHGGSLIPEQAIPFVYYAHPINDKLALGFGLFVPFGAETNYGKTALSSGFAGKTKLTTVDFQPAFSYKVTDTFAIGGGLDIVYAQGTLTKSLDLIPYVPTALGTPAGIGGMLDKEEYKGYENTFEVEGDDTAIGWNLGFMWDITPATTLGLTYRSAIDFTLEGEAEFGAKDGVKAFSTDAKHPVTGTALPPGIYPVDGATGKVPNQKAEVPLTGPQSVTLSLAHQLTDSLQVQGGVTWTDWSSFKYFDVKGKGPGMISALSEKSMGLTDNYIGHIVENWHDTYAYAIGATYTLNPQWLLRAGFAYDESPVDRNHRTARVPDNDRKWLTAGARFAPSQDLSFDLGLAYAFIDGFHMSEVDYNLNDQQSSKQRIEGDYELNAFGASMQMNYRY